MLTGQLQQTTPQESSFANKAWQDVFDWLKNIPQDNAAGKQLIRENDIFANFINTETYPRENGIMEAHKEYVDLHYCISGGEQIEWAPTTELSIQKEYEAENDTALYVVPQTADTIIMTPGKFAIFFPDEAHMPKINDDVNSVVKKVVIKIKANLLNQA